MVGQVRPELRVPISDLGCELRPYQAEAVEILIRKTQGVLVLPCGGGKTTTGAAAIVSLDQPAIVLVHTGDLLEQWVKTLEWVGARSVRVVRGSGSDLSPLRPGEVAACMVGALQDKDEAAPLLGSASIMLVDECHRAPAKTWSRVINRCPARWRWGLTATPERSDGWGFLLGETFGPVLYEKQASELIDLGYLLRPLIVPVRVPWRAPASSYYWMVQCPSCSTVTKVAHQAWAGGEAICGSRRCGDLLPTAAAAKIERMNWSAAVSEWAASGEARETVRLLAVAATQAGRSTLALVARKSAARLYADDLRGLGVEAEAVSSDAAMQARLERIERLRGQDVEVLVATQLADEGLDIPGLDCLILAQHGRSSGQAKQRSGRTTRPAGATVPIVFDLVVDDLSHQWRVRRASYVSAYGDACLHSQDPIPLQRAVGLLGGQE